MHQIPLGDFSIHWDNTTNETKRVITVSSSFSTTGKWLTLQRTGLALLSSLVITRRTDSLSQSVATSEFVPDHCAAHCYLDLQKPKYARGEDR